MGILHPGITQSELVLRSEIGRRLTISEMDGNFVYLEDLIVGTAGVVVGVPTGGTAGYILAKASSTDYDTQWIENTGGGGASSAYLSSYSGSLNYTLGIQSIYAETDLSYTEGDYILAFYDPSKYLIAKVEAYNPTDGLLQFDSIKVIGSGVTNGTHSINLSGYTSGIEASSTGTSVVGNNYFLESNDFDLLDSSKLTTYVVDQDNDNIEISLPEDFGSFEFLGSTYSSLFINTNSYVTFGGTSSESQIMAPGKIGIPALFIGAGDNSLQYLSIGYEYDVEPGDMGDQIFRIRFEGSANQDGSLIGLVGLAWELHLDKSSSDIKVVVASLGNNVSVFRNERNPGGVYGISDGEKWIDIFPSLPTFEEESGSVLNTVVVTPFAESSADAIKFVGPGVNSFIYGTVSYVKIDPLSQFGLSVGYDNLTSSPAASVISSNRYDLRLTTGENGSAVRIRPRGEAWIQPFPKNTNQVGNGSSVFIFAGGASRDGDGIGTYSGGNVYLQGGAGAGGDRGSVYIGLTSSPWIFDPAGDLTLPIGGDIKDSFGSSVLGGGGASLTERTYSQMASLIGATALTPGAFYSITDFKTCYDQPDYDIYRDPIYSGNYRVGNTHSIVVFATSESTLAMDAWQPDFPNDKIKYDFSWSVTEITGGTAYGRITERIDEWNNRTDYDHREILFKRYDTFVYNPNNPQAGTISVANGVVSGIDTTFQNFSPGDVIAIPYFSEIFFEIGSITSNGTMSLTGSVWNVTANNIKYHSISYTMNSGSYYKNNVHDYSEGSPYMYEISTFGNALGAGGAHDNYIGDCASGFINNISGDFLLANNVFLTGRYANNRFGNNCFNNTFDDDCTNNTIGNWFYNNIADDDFDDNQIGNDFRNNIITANFQINVVGDDFYSNAIVNSDFNRNEISGLFYGNNISGSIFTNNNVDRNFRNNTISILFEKNTLGKDFYLNTISTGSFQQNVIGNSFTNNDIATDGNGFLKNFIGFGFDGNDIRREFDGNSIGNGTNANVFYSSMADNKIGDYFQYNSIGTTASYSQFIRNRIGNSFISNNTKSDFSENAISNRFYQNTVYSVFDQNQVENEFESNTIGNSTNMGDLTFGKNRIAESVKGNLFSGEAFSNEIGNNFYANILGGYFSNNRIGPDSFFNTIGTNFGNNEIGASFTDNNILNDFGHNRILNNFMGNNISNFFSFNEIGSYFQYNNISTDFGFGGAQSRGNTIGNNFTNNIVGEYFYDNRVADLFSYNTLGDYFQLNDIKINYVHNINFRENYNTIQSFTTNIASSIPGANGTYLNLGATGGSGHGAEFDVTVSGSVVTSVAIQAVGYQYTAGNTMSIPYSLFGGTPGFDIVITVGTVSGTPSVYGAYNTDIFKNSAGTSRLSYYDADDVLTIKGITE